MGFGKKRRRGEGGGGGPNKENKPLQGRERRRGGKGHKKNHDCVTGILSRRGGRGREERRKKADFPYTIQKCSYKKLCFFSLTYHVDAGGDDEETHDHHEGAHDLKHRPGKYDANHHH